MKKSRTPKEIKELTISQLRMAITSLQNSTWDDDDFLRKLAIKVHGDDNVMSMLALAVPLAVELEERTKLDYNFISTKNMTEEQLHDYNKWLIEVWNPNQLYIPFVEDAPRAYLRYKNEESQKESNERIQS